MVIKGTVQNGVIQFEGTALPEGTHVLITPIESTAKDCVPESNLDKLKEEVQRIASLACENESTDGFSGADHDKVLYGN